MKAQNTVFATLPGKGDPAELGLDVEALREAFVAKTSTFGKGKKNGQEGGSGSGGASAEPTVVSVLAGQRATNIEICMAKIPHSVDELVDAVTSLDVRILTPSLTETLLKTLLPTEEEESVVREFSGDHSLLTPGDAVAVRLMGVPCARAMLEAHMFMLTYPEEDAAVAAQILCCRTALQTLRDSQGLARALALVLATGNTLNAGTSRGGASGFKFSICANLASTKGVGKQGGTRSLMHFLADSLGPDSVGSMAEEMDSILKAARELTLSQIRGGVNVLIAQAKEIGEAAGKPGAPPVFASRFVPFIQAVTGALASLGTSVDELETEWSDTARWFGEDPKSIDFQDFLDIACTFLGQLMDATADNVAAAEEVAKKAARKARRRKLRAALSSAKRGTLTQEESGEGGEGGESGEARVRVRVRRGGGGGGDHAVGGARELGEYRRLLAERIAE